MLFQTLPRLFSFSPQEIPTPSLGYQRIRRETLQWLVLVLYIQESIAVVRIIAYPVQNSSQSRCTFYPMHTKYFNKKSGSGLSFEENAGLQTYPTDLIAAEQAS